MDSGDESVGEASSDEARGGSASEKAVAADRLGEARAGRTSEDSVTGGHERPKEDEDRRPLATRVAEVKTFSDMVRLAPLLTSRAQRMQPKELAATVTAAARVRFYDADVFQSGLLPAARKHLQKPRGGFGVEEAADLIVGLAELNAYDEGIFSKAVEVFADKKQELEDPVRRAKLLAAFRAAGHQGDKDFIEYLAQREKAERYEQRLREMQGSSGPQIYYGGLRK